MNSNNIVRIDADSIPTVQEGTTCVYSMPVNENYHLALVNGHNSVDLECGEGTFSITRGYNCTVSGAIPNGTLFEQVHLATGYASTDPNVQSPLAGMDKTAALLANRIVRRTLSSTLISCCWEATSAIDAYPHYSAIRAPHAMLAESVPMSNGTASHATTSTLLTTSQTPHQWLCQACSTIQATQCRVESWFWIVVLLTDSLYEIHTDQCQLLPT